ncbi:MAG: PadR family transcriptional regulator [Oscillospiraceae bacterium]|nr:PadR family transcriptional regulator [Oscillospiraceae bacterium]
MRSNDQGTYRRGLLPLAVLSLLKNGEKYGYELVQDINRYTDGAITTQEGSLYPVLYKLLEEGHIADERRLVGKRMMRVYYHIQPSGEELRKQLEAEYRSVTAGMFKLIETE